MLINQQHLYMLHAVKTVCLEFGCNGQKKNIFIYTASFKFIYVSRNLKKKKKKMWHVDMIHVSSFPLSNAEIPWSLSMKCRHTVCSWKIMGFEQLSCLKSEKNVSPFTRKANKKRKNAKRCKTQIKQITIHLWEMKIFNFSNKLLRPERHWGVHCLDRADITSYTWVYFHSHLSTCLKQWTDL